MPVLSAHHSLFEAFLFTQHSIWHPTTSLFFHVWNVAGWIFLFWAIVIFFGYYYYRFAIYFMPILESFRDILKDISNIPPTKQGEEEKQAT